MVNKNISIDGGIMEGANHRKGRGDEIIEKLGVANLAYDSFKAKYRRFRAYVSSYIGL